MAGCTCPSNGVDGDRNCPVHGFDALFPPTIPVELRSHDAYAQPLDGGYQARCWDCDWRGATYLCSDEDATGRAKRNARIDAAHHGQSNQIVCCSRCKRALTEAN